MQLAKSCILSRSSRFEPQNPPFLNINPHSQDSERRSFKPSIMSLSFSSPSRPISLIKFEEDDDHAPPLERMARSLPKIGRKVSFEGCEEEKMEKGLEKKQKKTRNLQKCSMESEIMQFIILKNKTFLRKMAFFLKKFMVSHICAALLSLVFIFMQNSYAEYCYMPPNCLCGDEMKVKIYVFFKEYFTYWMIYISFFLQSVFSNQLFPGNNSLKKLLYLALATIFVFCWIMFSSENNYMPLFVYVFLLFLSLAFEIIELLKKKESLLEKMRIFFRINQFAFVVFINYLFYLFVYQGINRFLLNTFSPDTARNLISLYISFYTLTITYLLKRVVLAYSFFLIKMSHRNTHAVIFAMRSALCLFVSIPASNLLKMNLSDWGGWFLTCSYSNFLIGFYFRVDFFSIGVRVFRKIFRKTQQKEVKQSPNDEKTKKYIERLLSGCVLDIQLICCFRILMLFVSERWSGAYMWGGMYKNCRFEIQPDEFKMNLWGVVILVVLNVSLAVFVFFYMIRTQNQLILYKLKHNFPINVYLLFLYHCFLEAMINMFYLYIRGANVGK